MSPNCDVAITLWFGEVWTSPNCGVAITFNSSDILLLKKCEEKRDV